MSRLEEVWRGWQALNMHDRARFLHLFREAYRQEREERMVANRRPAGEPVTISDFDRMTLAALDSMRAFRRRARRETYVLARRSQIRLAAYRRQPAPGEATRWLRL